MNITRVVLIATAALAISAPAATAQTREYEGTVVSVDRSNRTFRIHDSERGTIRVRVTSRTRFERVSFSTLRAGARNIETSSAAPTAAGSRSRSSAQAAAAATAGTTTSGDRAADERRALRGSATSRGRFDRDLEGVCPLSVV